MLATQPLQELAYFGIESAATSETNYGLVGLGGFVGLGRLDRDDLAPMASAAPGDQTGLSGLAFLASGELIATTTDAGASQLVRIDASTGARLSSTPLIGPAGPVSIDDLAFDTATRRLFGVGRSGADADNTLLVAIDPDTSTVSVVAELITTGAVSLAATPSGELYAIGDDAAGSPSLFQLDPATGAVLASAPLRSETLFEIPGPLRGLAARDDGVLVATGETSTQVYLIDTATGTLTIETTERPDLGVIGDLAFQPGTRPSAVTDVYREDFETGEGDFSIDNTGGTLPGMWRHSVGRRDDGLISHTPLHSFYYGRFETAIGRGNYITNPPIDHRGVIASPTIALPAEGASIVSFNYLLDVRPDADRDFVEVQIDAGGVVTTILSKADGTLPQTGRSRWRTATYDLSAFAGQEVSIRFSFDTGDPPPFDPEGWYVDDLRIINVTDIPIEPGSIAGQKYNDLDSDDNKDANEPGLNGVTIRATRIDDATIFFETTTADIDLNGDGAIDPETERGRYRFDELAPGEYRLSEVAAPDAVVMPFDPFVIEVTCGEETAASPIGNVLFGGVHGLKYHDADGDGVFDDGENPLAGATFRLIGPGGFDEEVTTGDDGRYDFGPLEPGVYTLREVGTPAGAVAPTPELTFILQSGQLRVGADGLAPPGPGQFTTVDTNLLAANTLFGAIHGLKVGDDDRDGVQDDDETPKAGAVFQLVGPDSYSESFTTGSDGIFSFEDLVPGDYTLTETTPPPGYDPVTGSWSIAVGSGVAVIATPGLIAIDPWQAENVSDDLIVLNPLTPIPPPPTFDIRGIKFNDANVNFQRDAGERGLSGVGLELREPDGTVVDSTTTGEDGVYTFLGVEAGTYDVVEVTGPAGRSGDLASVEITVDLQDIDDLDIANRLFGAVLGVKFNDLNGDGDRDAGEGPLAGATFTLTPDGGAALTAISDSNGRYAFENLAPGAYTLSETTPPDGFEVSTRTLQLFVGSGQALIDADGAATIAAWQEAVIDPELAYGNVAEPPPPVIEVREIQFITPLSVYRQTAPASAVIGDGGVAGGGAIEGTIFVDINGDGERNEALEPGASGLRVFIDTNEDGIIDPEPGAGEISAVTDIDGKWAFENLAAGTYLVRLDPAQFFDNLNRIIDGQLVEGARRLEPLAPGDALPGDVTLSIAAGGTAVADEVGFFEYSTFVRPADDHLGHIDPQANEPTSEGRLNTLQDSPPFAASDTLYRALAPFQQEDLGVVDQPSTLTIEKRIAAHSGADASTTDAFVTVYYRTDGSDEYSRLDDEATVAAGSRVELFAFYDPVRRAEGRVVAQYPSWLPEEIDDSGARFQPHTFAEDDHLLVMLGEKEFHINLIGGSTFDSDVTYDGVVDTIDLTLLEDLLRTHSSPVLPGEDGFDPTIDINTRTPNGAEGVVGEVVWPVDGQLTREIALGDFGPLQVEWDDRLDEDPDGEAGQQAANLADEAFASFVPVGSVL